MFHCVNQKLLHSIGINDPFACKSVHVPEPLAGTIPSPDRMLRGVAPCFSCGATFGARC
jgi:hypothetical protein